MKQKFVLFFLVLTLSLSTSLFSQSTVENILNAVNSDSIHHFVKELSGEVSVIVNGQPKTIVTRYYSSASNDVAANYIKQKLEGYGLNVSFHNFSSNGTNVIGVQTGTEFPDQKYIICAHYDDMPSGSVAPGADDNASGTAAVLEAARIFSQYDFPFTLIYALWDEEEMGLIGSEHWAQEANSNGEQILGVINLDMIGWDSDSDMECDIHTKNIANSIELCDKMVELNTQYNIGLQTDIINPGAPYSDHQSFWDEGYTAILLIEDDDDFNDYYHSTNDKIMYFNQVYYYRMAKLAYATLAHLVLNLDIEIIHTPASSIAHTGDIVLSADISSGLLIGTGPTAPRLYYRVNSGGGYSDFYEVVGVEQDDLYSYEFTIPGQPLGTAVQYYLAAQDVNSEIVKTLPSGGSGFDPPGNIPPDNFFQFFVAPENVAVEDHADNMNNWTTNDSWSTTSSKYTSPPTSFTDSPLGDYSSNENSYLKLNNKIDLTNCLGAIVEFEAQWDIETDWDYAMVQVSTNNGAEWIPLEGMYTNPGTGSFQPNGEPLYDGSQNIWVHEYIDISDFAGQEIDFRFLLRSDGYIEWDGFYVDDIMVYTYNFVPVELISFNADVSPDKVSLNWITSSELNNKGFEVQRSTDTNQWETLQFVSGNGTTTEQSYYSYVDNEPVIGKAYYRLRQIDYDGSYKIHKQIEVDLTSVLTYALEQNYPNPFNPVTIIKYSIPENSFVTIKVYDVTGKEVSTLVNEKKDAGVYELKFNGNNLPSGVYIYRILTDKFTSVKKMILLR